MNRSTSTNTKDKKRITTSVTWTAVAILLVCVVLTFSIVGAAIELFARTNEPDTVISILPPEAKTAQAKPKTASATVLSVNQTAAPMPLSLESSEKSQSGIVSLANTSFYVGDNRQTWSNLTDIDIFRVSYENGAGIITVAGKNGDKIVAPGTSNTYLFHLTNDGKAAIDYDLNISATLSDNLKGYTVPVRVRLSDDAGTWLCGNLDTWENFTALDGTNKKAVLGANCYSSYTLEWEWPYESGDDDFDTLLGNLAENEDIVLTIHIDVTAEYDPDPEMPGGNPQTGYNSHMELWVLLMILSLMGLIVVIILGKHNRERNEV